MPAPPPMRFVSREERSQLNNAKDAKSRIQTTIDLAAEHLANAETYTAQRQFNLAAEELGRYWGLLDDVEQFLFSLNSNKNKVRDLYRHAEFNIHKLVPRLAVMRRDTPTEYAGHIKDAEDFTRDLRSKILDSFYGAPTFRLGSPGAGEEKKADTVKGLNETVKRP